ncbi:1875_t:CDS:2 [Funneliformis caledonium]|uniref:1875_t:CDS:1 n=2 Tax=Funneliformis TaxID=1117308 RepID=A0A9N8WND7_9GLOM|nr:14155_t:CDS:2 [Funneliformis mosseae]CAG8488251.1 1875_t:CDS:2 [Funneliformis caledonium]
MPGILEKTNKVIDYQMYFQSNASTPLWKLKGPGRLGGPARIGFVYLYFGSLALGLTGSIYGVSNMARGKKN